MVNKLRFGEEDILGQVISRLESAVLLYKKNNTAAREMSQSIAELNAKLLMLEQLRAKGYLAPEVHQTQSRDINNQLAKLKKERQTELDSHIIQMLDDVKHLKTILEELEDPLERFDEKLFTEVVKAISIDHNDEMTLTMIGGLRFTELI
jgi:predicted nuclease with TOPRIM domain